MTMLQTAKVIEGLIIYDLFIVPKTKMKVVPVDVYIPDYPLFWLDNRVKMHYAICQAKWLFNKVHQRNPG